jgi:hypothetical protein
MLILALGTPACDGGFVADDASNPSSATSVLSGGRLHLCDLRSARCSRHAIAYFKCETVTCHVSVRLLSGEHILMSETAVARSSPWRADSADSALCARYVTSFVFDSMF